MSTKQQIRNRNRAVIAYRMQKEGATTNEIVRALNLKPHQVRSVCMLGERLESLKDS